MQPTGTLRFCVNNLRPAVGKCGNIYTIKKLFYKNTYYIFPENTYVASSNIETVIFFIT